MPYRQLGEYDVVLMEPTQTAAGPSNGFQSQTTYADGDTIRGSVQPADGKTVDLLPEGVRARDAVVWYARAEVPAVDPRDGTARHRFRLPDGRVFSVQSVEPFGNGRLAHWRVVGVRVPELTRGGAG